MAIVAYHIIRPVEAFGIHVECLLYVDDTATLPACHTLQHLVLQKVPNLSQVRSQVVDHAEAAKRKLFSYKAHHLPMATMSVAPEATSFRADWGVKPPAAMNGPLKAFLKGARLCQSWQSTSSFSARESWF